MDYKIVQFEKHSDKRGELIVFLQEPELRSKFKEFGQIYFVTFSAKGVIRGNHYHKKWREWFGIVSGKMQVKLVDVDTKEEINFVLDAKHDKYTRIEVGPKVVHAFKCLTKYGSLLNYATSPWSDSDDFSYKII